MTCLWKTCLLPLALAGLIGALPVLPGVAAPLPASAASSLPGSSHAKPKAAPLSKNAHEVTVTSVDADAVHAIGDNGAPLDAAIKKGSLFLVNGKLVGGADFPGGKAILRTRTRASDGTLSVVLLSDLPSAAAITAYRKNVLVGQVLSMDDKTLVVQPGGTSDSTPLSLHLTPKTLFRHGGAEAAAAAFPAGAPVAIQTRGLPSGLLMAAIVSDTGTDIAQMKAANHTSGLSGSASDIDTDKGLLRITPKTKPGQTVAVAQNTRIKVRKAEASLKDITPGMHVTARLSAQQDSAGHPVAASLSAFDAAVPHAKKKAAAKSKMP